jgi:hypothetical protein
MQKVVGSSPIIRFSLSLESPAKAGFLRLSTLMFRERVPDVSQNRRRVAAVTNAVRRQHARHGALAAAQNAAQAGQ